VPELPVMESAKRYFPDYDFIIWTKEKIRKLMENNGDHEILNAFDTLKPYAYKADLAKYYILDKFGGWYSDINNKFVNFPPDLGDSEMLFFRDFAPFTDASWAVCLAIVYSKKENIILKNAIKDVVKNCKNKYYGGNPLAPTGPLLFGSAIARENLAYKTQFIIGDFIGNPRAFVLNGSQVFAKYKSTLGGGEVGIAGGNSYNDFWHARKVYGE
jgi:hypothetical protein